MVKLHDVRDESGQAMMEYILLLAIVVSFYVIVAKGLTEMGISEKLMRPLTESFASAYQYGHPKAKGYDDGGPEYHPRAVEGGTNFRIFIRTDR